MHGVRYANRKMKILSMHSTAVQTCNPLEIPYWSGIKTLSNRAHVSLNLLVWFLQVQQIRRSSLWCYGTYGTGEIISDSGNQHSHWTCNTPHIFLFEVIIKFSFNYNCWAIGFLFISNCSSLTH